MKTITKTMAANIHELADLLNHASEKRKEFERDQEPPYVPKVDEMYDLAALPTFGGPEPQDTTEIYSWNTVEILMRNDFGARPWVVIVREDV